MTPLPKGLSRRQALAWRRMISAGFRPGVASAFVGQGRQQPALTRPHDAQQAAASLATFTTFASGHGFVNQTTQTQQNIAEGLRLITDGAGTVNFTRKSGITLNMTDRQFKIRLRVDDYTRIADLILYVTSDAFTTSASVRLAPSTVPSTTYLTSGDWVTITLSKGDFGGSVNWAAINAMQIRVKDRATGALTVDFDYIDLIDEPDAGVVSVTFDDGLANQYSNALPILRSAGLPATAYLIADRIGASGYLTDSQVDEMQAAGWEIAAHANTLADHNARFDTLADDVVDADFAALRRWLFANQRNGADHLAYPGGGFDNAVLALVDKHFTSARTIYGAGSTGIAWSETLPPADPRKLRCWSVTNTDTVASVNAAVDRAVANKHWLILCFHNIVAAPSVATEFSTANFQSVVDHIKSAGATVKTVGQVL